MRHYVNEEGVYLHVDDLENSLREIAHKLPKGDYRRAVETVADAMHGHKTLVLEDSVSRLFSFAGGLR
jgi:hypothetical protein